jgi:actin-like ATPase involved in cell morphogenesis
MAAGTGATVASGDSVTVLDIESNGQSRMPSSVFLAESGELLVGTAAAHQSAFAPERFEATPKRSIADGEVFLGEEMVSVSSLIAAVLGKVFGEAVRRQGGAAPRAVRLTHPAEWGQGRLDVLREAAAAAGMAAVSLVPEPVAAAVWIAGAVTNPGERIAVYDFGGGTFDAAVLRRSAEGFEVAGPPAGRDPLGGEDIDRRIVDFIGSVVGAENPDTWAQLLTPSDVTWRRRSIGLRMEAQRAKETLSEVSVCQLWIPGLEREFQLTRVELERLIAADLDLCTQTLQQAMQDAGVTATDLSGVYLVGGSSRIPLAADKLWRALGIAPKVQDSPKSVVALGAARWTAGAAGLDAPPPPRGSALSERTIVTSRDARRVDVVKTDQRGQTHIPPSISLTLPVTMSAWRDGVFTSQSLMRTGPGRPATLRIRDEPALGKDVNALAARAAQVRAARVPSFVDYGLQPATFFGSDALERNFTTAARGETVAMSERYAIDGDRALVMAYPGEHLALADALKSANTSPARAMRAPAILPAEPDWVSSEDLRLVGPDGMLVLQAQRVVLPAEPEQAWRWHELERLLRSLPDAAVVSRFAGPVLSALSGEIVTVQWSRGPAVGMTKLGSAVSGPHGFLLRIDLPLARQNEFETFAAMVAIAAPA